MADEFRRIDQNSEDGLISRKALWGFLSSGKAGEMNESDFNALFAAIDLQKKGKVDFLEFCTFMAGCHEDFEKVKNRESVRAGRASMVDKTSVRLSLAQSTARRLSHQTAVPEFPETSLESKTT
mgnify:CR=1 FL=1